MQEFIKRFMNYGSLVAFLGIVGFFLPYLGVHIVPEQFDLLVQLICSFFISAGIINNPASGTGYKDQ